MKCKLLLFTTLALCLSAISLAQNVLGKWTGELVIDVPQNVRTQTTTVDLAKPKLLMSLTLKADKTYTATTHDKRANKKSTVEGTWTLSGETLELKPLKRDGKPVSEKGGSTRSFVLSKDGKTLTMDYSNQVQSKKVTEKGTSAIKIGARMVLKKA